VGIFRNWADLFRCNGIAGCQIGFYDRTKRTLATLKQCSLTVREKTSPDAIALEA